MSTLCDYCFTRQDPQCYGWDEARRCSGFSGTSDPKYLAAKRSHVLYCIAKKTRDLKELERKHDFELRSLKASLASEERELRRIDADLSDRPMICEGAAGEGRT